MTENNSFLKKWFWLIAALGMVIGFLLLSSEIQEARQGQTEMITKVDDQIRLDLIGIRTVALDSIAVDVTALGSVTVLSFLVGILCLLFLATNRSPEALHLLAAGLGAGIITQTLKVFLRIPRPDALSRLVHVTGYSFPSGHTLSAASIYLTVAILIFRNLKSSIKRKAIGGAFAVLILAVSLSRLYLGVHNLSDVLGGILIGTSWALILSQIPNLFHRLGKKIERI